MDFSKVFNSNAEFILCKLLNCDKYELRLLDTIENETLLMESIQAALSYSHEKDDNLFYSTMKYVFSGKLEELEDIRWELIGELDKKNDDKELLEVCKMIPSSDIRYTCEKDNISIYFVANVDLYKKYFKDWVDSVAKDTGYTISVK